jgi:ATP-binding cassette, subfamily C, bacterial PrsD
MLINSRAWRYWGLACATDMLYIHIPVISAAKRGSRGRSANDQQTTGIATGLSLRYPRRGESTVVNVVSRRNLLKRYVISMQPIGGTKSASAMSESSLNPTRSRSIPPKQRSELSAALRACRSAFVGTGILSGLINVLMLTGSFYMLEVYDRVLPSRSVPTLVGLTILAGILFVFLAILELIRGRLLVRIGAWLDESLSERVYDAIIRLPLRTGNRGDGIQPLRDLDNIRSFLSGVGPTALFDLPWMPVFLAICFAFHILIGLAAFGGAIALIGLTLLTEHLTREPLKAASTSAVARNDLADKSRRNAEVLVAMGMSSELSRGWRQTNSEYMAQQRRASDVAGALSAVSKSFRFMLQSAVLGLGGYLVVKQEATAGVIIAASILTARALAPVDLAIANWRGFVTARQSWERLVKLLAMLPLQSTPMRLPTPCKNLTVENASAVPPGEQRLVIQDINFTLKSGHGLGIIGPSASGKSSLARMLVGVWQPVRGKVCLDQASLDQWDFGTLGKHIGYLPQDVELLAGTVAQNISRFESSPDPKDILAAAQAAGVHELIVGLRAGYGTPIGEQGAALSAGQQQRIALARALYRDPFLVVLDEPNSNLDSEGEEALSKAILGVRSRGGIVVVIAHRPSALAGVDLMLVMGLGRQQIFGPKDEVMRRFQRRDAPVPLKVVSEGVAPSS